MIRKILISTAALMIALGPALHELQKLPGIMSHYRHHIEVHGETDLSFVDYLLSHFGDQGHEDADHASLPFHGHTACSGHTVVVPQTADLLSVPVTVVRTHVARASNALPSSHPSRIFQPPRV